MPSVVFHPESHSFEVSDNGQNVLFSVVGATSSSDSNNGVMMCELPNNLTVQVFADINGTIQILTSNDGALPISAHFITSEKALVFNGNLSIGPFTAVGVDATLAVDDNGFHVLSSMQFARIEVLETPPQSSPKMSGMSLKAMSAYDLELGTDAKTEFTITIFDDAAMTRVRPVKNGAFVVSTVPSLHGSEALSDTDQTYYDLGVGPETRTLYFKVCASHYPEATPPISPVAPKLKLLMPNGIDTLADPVDVTLTQETYVASNSSWVMPTWTGSYVFHVEDTVNYVDGIGYVFAYMDTAVLMSTEMHLDVVESGDSTDDFGPEELVFTIGDSTQF